MTTDNRWQRSLEEATQEGRRHEKLLLIHLFNPG